VRNEATEAVFSSRLVVQKSPENDVAVALEKRQLCSSKSRLGPKPKHTTAGHRAGHPDPLRVRVAKDSFIQNWVAGPGPGHGVYQGVRFVISDDQSCFNMWSALETAKAPGSSMLSCVTMPFSATKE